MIIVRRWPCRAAAAVSCGGLWRQGHLVAVEDGVGEGAVALVLDGLPVVAEEPEEVLEDRGGLLLGETQLLHGLQRLPRPLRVRFRTHPSHLPSFLPIPASFR
ncbi:Os04g0692850, partial [Oryza sativa Japonica Group]